MEQRNILQPNTELRFDSYTGSSSSYIVEGVLGIGSLCVLYLAYYLDNLGLKKYVKIKEYNPAQINLKRNEDLSFEVQEREREYFLKMKERVIHSYLVSHELIQEEHISNSISNAENIHEANGTTYIVYSYMEGKDLAHYQVKSLQESIQLTESVTKAINRIHKAGYLYLDIKPENILILDGTTDLIQLFDFDSLVPINETAGFAETRITFSKGFSPVEQRLGDWSKIGKHSDIYSIGALLYYLIYGTPPKAVDCNRRKPYDFKKAKYDFYDFPDSLGRKLSEIFQRTLQSYIKDRYKDAEVLFNQLAEVERLSDPSLEYVLTQIPSYRTQLIGREEEILEIERWMKSDSPVLLVTGMGGIGKSSIVTEALKNHKELFDSVSYMRFHRTLTETLADDNNLCLHSLKKDPVEDVSGYMQRKLAHVKRLSKENRILIVIDNYEETLTEELVELFDIGCKVILVSRQIETAQYPVLPIKSIQKYEKQKELFLYNLGNWNLSSEDEENVFKIIALLHGHTLSIELLAKQIQSSFLTLPEAVELIKKKGFSKVGTESVLYEKDGSASYKTIYRIISSLYELEGVSAEQRTILKMLCLSDIRGVGVRLFLELNSLESKEEINKLIRMGWISLNERSIYLHPLISEVVRNAAWEENDIYMLNHLVIAMENKIESLSSIFTIGGEELLPYLDYAKGMLSYHDLKNIIGEDRYDTLWCYVSANLQRDDEAYILNCAKSIDANLIPFNRMLLKLWDISVKMLCEARDYSEAMKMISVAREYLQQVNVDDYAWAFFHGNIEEEYYDSLIYDPELTDLQERYIDCLFEANQKAIHFASVSDDGNEPVLCAEYITDRANFLIRMQGADREELWALLELCKQIVSDLPKRELEIEIGVHLAYMWFYTIYDAIYEEAIDSWNRAKSIGDEIGYPDLEKIDALIVPGAEIEVDFRHYDKSIKLLNTGIEICEKHPDSVPYIRKKNELLDHIQDVIAIKES